MFTSGNFEPDYSKKYRYLIKGRGVWKRENAWTINPWNNLVTDAIWLQDPKTSWWHIRNGKSFYKDAPMVTDDELTMILLQVEHAHV